MIENALEHHETLVELMVLRDAAATKRYHTKRTVRIQSLADHSFGVMQIIHFVWPECRKEVLLAGMHHDLPEYVTGDIPAPMKRRSPQLALLLDEIEQGTAPLYQDFDLSVAEEKVLAWADTWELVMWCHEEVLLGNQYCMDTLKRGLGWCTEGHHLARAVVPPHVVERMGALVLRMTVNVEKANGSK